MVRDRLHHARRQSLGASSRGSAGSPTSASSRGSRSRAPGSSGSAAGARRLPKLELFTNWAYSKRLPPRLRAVLVARPARLRLRGRRRRGLRRTASGATSTSTRSTRRTVPAGGARTPSSRTTAPGSSVTASTRTTRTRAIPQAGRRPEGKGERYRATAIGPGVMPDVTWEGAAPVELRRGARPPAASRAQRTLYPATSSASPSSPVPSQPERVPERLNARGKFVLRWQPRVETREAPTNGQRAARWGSEQHLRHRQAAQLVRMPRLLLDHHGNHLSHRSGGRAGNSGQVRSSRPTIRSYSVVKVSIISGTV